MILRSKQSVVVLAMAILVGCASSNEPTGKSTLLARGVLIGSSVTVPAGTKYLYFVQRGPFTMTTGRYPLGATTLPAEIPLAPLFWPYSTKRPLNVYAIGE